MGIQLNWEIIMSLVKKPVGLIIGILCQWGLMAPLAAGWGILLLPTINQQFRLFCVGSCPGGGNSNKFALLLDGNLDLSITLTFFSNICALFMLPLWVYTLGRHWTSQMGVNGESIDVPFGEIGKSLAITVIPAIIGMVIRHFKPHWAKKSLTAVKWTSFLVIIIIVPFAISVSMYIFALFTWRTVLAGMTLPYSGFLISLITAYIFKQEYRGYITIAVETAIQNVTIAMFILRYGLPAPDNDLVLVVPVYCIIFTPLPIWFLLLFRTVRQGWWVSPAVRKCIRRRRGEAVEERAKDDHLALDEDSPGPLQVLLTPPLRPIRDRRRDKRGWGCCDEEGGLNESRETQFLLGAIKRLWVRKSVVAPNDAVKTKDTKHPLPPIPNASTRV